MKCCFNVTTCSMLKTFRKTTFYFNRIILGSKVFASSQAAIDPRQESIRAGEWCKWRDRTAVRNPQRRFKVFWDWCSRWVGRWRSDLGVRYGCGSKRKSQRGENRFWMVLVYLSFWQAWLFGRPFLNPTAVSTPNQMIPKVGYTQSKRLKHSFQGKKQPCDLDRLRMWAVGMIMSLASI